MNQQQQKELEQLKLIAQFEKETGLKVSIKHYLTHHDISGNIAQYIQWLENKLTDVPKPSEVTQQEDTKTVERPTHEEIASALQTILSALQHKEELLETLQSIKTEIHSDCPCKYTTPCNSSCTCANHGLSGGCYRCARYGSKEQKKQMAEHLAEIIDKTHSEQEDTKTVEEIAHKTTELLMSDNFTVEQVESIILQALQSIKTESGWTSVEDRLPELTENDMECKDVLCLVNWDGIEQKVLNYICSDGESGKFYLSHGNIFKNLTDFVTHWMPLHEPPQYKKENNK